MKWVQVLLVLLVLLVVAVVGVGFYQGWFQISTDNSGRHPTVTLGVDENKMQQDKKKVEGLGDKAKEDATGRADKVKDQEPRP